MLRNAALGQIPGLSHAVQVLEWLRGRLRLLFGVEHVVVVDGLLGLLAAVADLLVGRRG